MSENVIERLVEDIKHDAEVIRNNHPGPQGNHLADLVSGLADQIQTSTRPEQFMPPLEDWPEDAEWCAIGAEGGAVFFEDKPIVRQLRVGANWYGTIVGFGADCVIPLGIDWRTLIVSRAQMEKWEAENE